MELTIEEFLQGSLALTFVLISVVIGIKLLIKYKEYKKDYLILAGVTWAFIVSPWYSTAFNFLYVLITGISMTEFWYLLLGYGWLPIPLFSWLTLFTELKYDKKRKIVMIIMGIHGLLYEILFLYFMVTDISVVGAKTGLFNGDFSLPFLIYIMIMLTIALITGILFGLESFKAEEPEIKWKGKFIMAAFFSFIGGSLLDSGLISFTPLTLILVRLLLISSAVEYIASRIGFGVRSVSRIGWADSRRPGSM